MSYGKRCAAEQMKELAECADGLDPRNLRDYWDAIRAGVLEIHPLQKPVLESKVKWWNVWGLFPEAEGGSHGSETNGTRNI